MAKLYEFPIPSNPHQKEEKDCEKIKFIDNHKKLISYLEEIENMPLIEMLADPLSVNLPTNFFEAYFENYQAKKLKKIIKSLNTMNNIVLPPKTKENPFELNSNEINIILPPQPHLEDDFEGFGTLREVPEPSVYTKEKALHEFKDDFKRVNNIPKLSIQQPTFTRSLTSSASHSAFIKKLEKVDSTMSRDAVHSRISNEILTTTTFRNGILHSNPSQSNEGTKIPKSYSATFPPKQVQEIQLAAAINTKSPDSSLITTNFVSNEDQTQNLQEFEDDSEGPIDNQPPIEE